MNVYKLVLSSVMSAREGKRSISFEHHNMLCLLQKELKLTFINHVKVLSSLGLSSQDYLDAMESPQQQRLTAYAFLLVRGFLENVKISEACYADIIALRASSNISDKEHSETLAALGVSHAMFNKLYETLDRTRIKLYRRVLTSLISNQHDKSDEEEGLHHDSPEITNTLLRVRRKYGLSDEYHHEVLCELSAAPPSPTKPTSPTKAFSAGGLLKRGNSLIIASSTNPTILRM